MTTIPAFAVNFDYRCPFARNVHEHLLAALRAGAGWEVSFLPFSLTQAHVEEGGTPVWDDPARSADLLALEAGIAVRDRFPSRFLDAHQALFAARHDEGRDLRDPEVVTSALQVAGVDAGEVLTIVAGGKPRELVRAAHTEAVERHQVFGVPTFFVGERAAFARVMTRPGGDPSASVSTIERIVALIADHPELNEVKHTTIAR